MPPRRKVLVGALRVSVYAAVAIGLAACLSSAVAQGSPHVVAGYITAVHSPNGFDVNEEHVITTADTIYGPTEFKVAVGDSVEVSGLIDKHSKIVTAHRVFIHENPGQKTDQKLDGLGVIVGVISTAPEAVFAADGYRIRITPATEVRYPKEMKSLADVHPGVWVLYEGKLDQDRLLIASKVRFLEAAHAKAKDKTKDKVPPPNSPPDQEVSETPDGKQVMKVDEINGYDENNSYAVAADQALQARINRVGMSLVPAYQKQLPANDPSKIQFRFYAIDDPKHEVHSFPDGRILVSAQVAARFRNDDQLAAVLADGIARGLQAKAPVVDIQFNRTRLAEDAAVGAAMGLSGVAVALTVQHAADLKAQRERVALQLMAEAGYDPWQAPEAWRLVDPFKLPKDIGKLKYPARSGQQFEILNLQYRKPAATNATEATAMSQVGANEKP